MFREASGLNDIARRALLLLLSINLIGISAYYYSNTGSFQFAGFYNEWALYWYIPSPASLLISFSLFFSGLLVFVLSLKPSRRRVLLSIILSMIILVSSILASRILYLGLEPNIVLLNLPSKTDSYVIQTNAAKSIVNGENPYERDYRDILLNTLEPQLYTWMYRDGEEPYTVDEIIDYVHRFDYLPPAALWYIPTALLSIPGCVWDALATSIAFTVLYMKMRKPFKPLFFALIASSMFIYLAPSLLQDTVSGWLAPLIIAMAVPDNPILAGALLAWSASYRTYVGIFILFYLVAAYREGYDVKKILISMIVTGLILNIPFLILNPSKFIECNLLPLVSHFRPLDWGPGLATIGFYGIHLPKIFYNALVAGITLAGLVISYKYYHKLGYAIFIFPTLAMFCYYRPLTSYYIYFPLLGFIAYLTGFTITVNKDKDVDAHVYDGLSYFSTYALLFSFLSIMYIFGYMSPIETMENMRETNNLEYLLQSILISIALISPLILLKIFRRWREIDTRYILVGLSTFFTVIALIASVYFSTLNFTILGYNYKTYDILLPRLAAKDIVEGRNPYLIDHREDIFNSSDFGLIKYKIQYTGGRINIDNITPIRRLVPYQDPYGSEIKYNQRVSYITFYNYPPGLALTLTPAVLLNIPIGYWITLLYAVALITLFIKLIRSDNLDKMLMFIIVLYSEFYLSAFGFSFETNSTIWISLLMLAYAFHENPIIFGALTGFASASMPQATLLAPYIVVACLFEKGPVYMKKMVLSTTTTYAGIVLPFLLPNPVEIFTKMYFPIFASTPLEGVGFLTLFERIVLNQIWPIPVLMPIPYIVLLITLAIYMLYYDKLGETGLLLPILVIMFFHISKPDYMVYYPLIALITWITTTYQKQSIRHNPIDWIKKLLIKTKPHPAKQS